MWGNVYEGFLNTVPGIIHHVSALPQYAYTLPAMWDKAVLGNDGRRLPNEGWWNRLKRQWRDTNNEMRSDPIYRYIAKPGDWVKRNVTDPAMQWNHDHLVPFKKEMEYYNKQYPISAGLANFGGNALGWAVLPAMGSTVAKGLSHVPGKTGTVLQNAANIVGKTYNTVGSDAGAFDIGNGLQALGVPAKYAQPGSWLLSSGNHVTKALLNNGAKWPK